MCDTFLPMVLLCQEKCVNLQWFFLINNAMMKRFILIIFSAALLGCSGGGDKPQTATDTTSKQDFTAFDVQKDFADNGFTYFTKNLILCVGDSSESNAMAIGWGAIGNYLGHDRPAVTVYVAPARYTYEFMERHKRFTVMEFDDPRVWQYMGKYSGRDGDKAAALGLHLAYTEHGTPYYTEAKTVIECETMTAWHQSAEDFRNDTPKQWYDGFEAGIHTVYIGEVIGAWKK